MLSAEERLQEERRIETSKVLAGMYVKELDLTYLPIPKCGHHAITQVLNQCYQPEWVTEPKGEVIAMVRDPVERLESFYWYSQNTNPQYARSRDIPVESFEELIKHCLTTKDKDRNRHLQSQSRLLKRWKVDTFYRWDWFALADRLDVGTIGQTNNSRHMVKAASRQMYEIILSDKDYAKDANLFLGRVLH